VGGGSHQTICRLRKELWLDRSLWLKLSMTGESGPCPFYRHICLATEGKHRNLSQGTRVLDTNRCLDLAALLGPALTGLLITVDNAGQPLVCASAFQVSELRGFPNQISLSRNSQLVLWCGLQKKNRNPQIPMNLPVTDVRRDASSNAEVLGLQHLSSLTRLQAAVLQMGYA
jgi:hypothetical protein